MKKEENEESYLIFNKILIYPYTTVQLPLLDNNYNKGVMQQDETQTRDDYKI
jgi:hypothetical protein